MTINGPEKSGHNKAVSILVQRVKNKLNRANSLIKLASVSKGEEK
jgi:hypothetical protein